MFDYSVGMCPGRIRFSKHAFNVKSEDFELLLRYYAKMHKIDKSLVHERDF